MKKKKTQSEIEQEVAERFLQEKYANCLSQIRDEELEIEYLATPQGKARAAEEKGKEFVDKHVSRLKQEVEHRKSYLNFLKTKL